MERYFVSEILTFIFNMERVLQLTSPASQKSKDLNKVLLLLQDLDTIFESSYELVSINTYAIPLRHFFSNPAKGHLEQHKFIYLNFICDTSYFFQGSIPASE